MPPPDAAFVSELKVLAAYLASEGVVVSFGE
jgi:hypothetical protein